MMKLQNNRRGHRLCQYVFNASAGFFNFEPVLETLQKLQSIPFANEIVHHGIRDKNSCESPSCISALSHMEISYSSVDSSVRKAVESDPTQVEAMKMMLNERVVLVQGPPGTGKTYIGVQMVRAILAANPAARILCLCYTNHALDSFLESLLESGVDKSKFVRMGSSFKVTEKLKSRCLWELCREHGFSQDEKHQYRVLKNLEEDVDKQLQRHDLTKLEWGKAPQWWTTVKCALEEEDPGMVKELTIPTSTKGYSVVGSQGKKAHPGELWKKWCEGKQPGELAPELGKEADSIWKLNKEQRKAHRDDLNRSWAHEKILGYFSVLQRKGRHRRELQELRNSSRARVLKTANIIGCTTVSAAKQCNLLDIIAPDVVLVEEAGEIFESQVLVALGQCKQLIMIGDHQQLRPKAEHFRLRVEANQGHAYDRSLFERLVLERDRQGKALASLAVQHRMRPEISEFPRALMYSHLLDAPGTQNRPNVAGVLKNVMFFDHQSPEAEDADLAALGSSSKTNLFEVGMVVEIVRYLLLQDRMAPDRICKCNHFLCFPFIFG
jgi:superfamily I DNA and/or RNA helicase